VVHLLTDAGFENYQTTINVSRKMAGEMRDLVQRFVSASLEGWGERMASVGVFVKEFDPRKAYILEFVNKGIGA
jgi:hypothetical protein